MHRRGPGVARVRGVSGAEGHKAVVFEKRALPGGLNTTGIAPYKLHAEDVDRARSPGCETLGVEIRTGVEVGT